MPKQYRVIHAEKPDQLANNVNAAMKEGFQPLGGVAVMAFGAAAYFYQAMVK